MNDKSYNLYSKVIKLACRNVKSAFCQENGITDTKDVHVKIRDRDGLVAIVAAMFKNPESARTVFSQRVAKRVSISSEFPNTHAIDVADVFIGSVLESRVARISQKRLIMYLMAERYLVTAYDYDRSHPSEDKDKYINYAKDVLTEKYSLNFIGGFTFTERPRIEPSVLTGLKASAFNPMYALSSEDMTNKLAERCYVKEFESRGEMFVTGTPIAFDMSPAKDASDKSMIDVFVKKHKLSENEIITQLYESSFANMPLHKRRRRFVNLKSKNRDVEICPIGALKIKRQFAQIEATTKHSYITNYFHQNRPVSADAETYFFDQEAWMYHYMWQTEGIIYHQAGHIYLPDDTVIEIPESMKPWEFFHRINTVYAALFGFTPEDARGSSNWLIDSIRHAYTDEGNALYCLMLIDNRIKEIKAERKGD